MKVFISHSHHDKPFARQLADVLVTAGITVWIDDLALSPGDNIIAKIEEGIRSSDVIIAVLSKNYVSSKWAMQELSMFSARALSEDSILMIPALIEDCDIPIFLRDRMYVDFRADFDTAVKKILAALSVDGTDVSIETDRAARAESGKRSSLELHAKTLSHHLHNGELSLVCGAGLSAAAGAPTWPVLLNELLSKLIRRQLLDGPSTAEDQRKLAELYQEYFSPSALVVAQYLKNGLGADFLESVRRTLYAESPNSSDLLKAVADLCRPQRSRNSLNSIITFNFDDLIEFNLERNHIKYCAIYAEGQKANRSELPIYHVHGYLPRTGHIDDENSIVFSEDAYHSQFIDPFSWSNMVQLNHFGQNVCLFVGLSMSDPNLRRLLDVAMRKNPDRKANHYVFKRRNDPSILSDRIAALSLTGDDAETAREFMAMSEILEEQDSHNLGLNTIWIDDYSEIPPFLLELTADA